MIWILIPLCWTLAFITLIIGAHNFLKAEEGYLEMLERASERARHKVEREMRPQAEIDAEYAQYAAQARAMQNAYFQPGLAQAQHNALLGMSQQNLLGQHASQQSMFGLTGSVLRFGF